MQFDLEPGKTVELRSFSLVDWGRVRFIVRFVELDYEITYSVDVEGFEAWQEAHPRKNIIDYLKEHLLPSIF